MTDDAASSGGRGQDVVAYYFPVEIEVRSVSVVEIAAAPAVATEDVRELIDQAFQAFAAGLEHA